MNKARKLLEAETYRTISEMSNAIGFKNASFFFCSFVKRFGKKPSEYLYRGRRFLFLLAFFLMKLCVQITKSIAKKTLWSTIELAVIKDKKNAIHEVYIDLKSAMRFNVLR